MRFMKSAGIIVLFSLRLYLIKQFFSQNVPSTETNCCIVLTLLWLFVAGVEFQVQVAASFFGHAPGTQRQLIPVVIQMERLSAVECEFVASTQVRD